MLVSLPSLQQLQDEYAAYCSECDDIIADMEVEPDAENYRCEECGERSVMGIDNAVLMNLIKIKRDK